MVKETKKKQSRRRRERRGFWLPVLILCLIVAGGVFGGYKSGWFSKKSKNDETAVVDTKNINTAELGNDVKNKTSEGEGADFGSDFKNQAEAASKEQEVAKNEALWNPN